MSQPRRSLTRSEAVEILLGLTLMLGAIAWWSVPAAAFAAGAILLTWNLLTRRVA